MAIDAANRLSRVLRRSVVALLVLAAGVRQKGRDVLGNLASLCQLPDSAVNGAHPAIRSAFVRDFVVRTWGWGYCPALVRVPTLALSSANIAVFLFPFSSSADDEARLAG
jgi:hypothetical protein